MNCARVLIDGVSDLVYDYSIPTQLSSIQAGCRVEVFLRRRLVTGTVLELCAPAPEWEDKLSPLIRLLDTEPLISEEMMSLAKWVAEYYLCPLEQIMRCLLPETLREGGAQEKTQKRVILIAPPSPEFIQKLEKKAPKQAGILAQLSIEKGSCLLTKLGGRDSLSAVRALVKKGILALEEEAVLRDPDAGQVFIPSQEITLNEEQAQALATLQTAYNQRSTAKPQLLQGVTGSGKTEIYLQLTQKALSQGQSILILVPEISLTPQTIQRFKSRFSHTGTSIAILHSLLSTGEKFDEWTRIHRGEARIVIGARSAVFAPLLNLGLIIVDEEHDNSYKQESSPRYHGRDVAVLRARQQKALIVLGSATPSLESYAHAKNGKYDLITLTQRVDNQSMPIMRIIDMRQEAKKNNKSAYTIISDRLRAGMEQRLQRGEQIILFLNRRGFAQSLQCPDCGHVIYCPHCSLAMTYHRTDDRLICHLCAHQALAPRQCPECQSLAIKLNGYGTQKVEELIRALFPHATLARIDADISAKKNAVRNILADFRAQKIQVLLGTQMIAKGLDFPNVTLVGILNADLGLHVPDFRASERTFQLLTQVAGRAGRSHLEGEVIIQTFTPHAAAIQYARHHDCVGFCDQELELRSMFHLPPYSHFFLITCRGTHERLAEFSLQTLHRKLQENIPPHCTITDPLPATITKAHGQYRFQITLNGLNARQVSQHIKNTLAQVSLPRDITCIVDVDARSFL